MAKKPKLNEGQEEALKAIKRFLDSPADTFVLKGYAGTGKTFLMQYLAAWLNDNKEKFKFLASTGRAASVLRGKTGFSARTLHGELYQFNRINGDHEDLDEEAPVEKYGPMTLEFSLREPDAGKVLYIVDESSMLSSEPPENEGVLLFGSGSLLSDFFNAIGSNKVIFVGDPLQLPPVGQATSPALDMDWLASQNRMAISTTLKKIERTDAGNDILVLAGKIRSMAKEKEWPVFPKIPASHLNNVTLYDTDTDLFQSYLSKYKELGVNGALAISRSNEMVRKINRALRRDLYGELDLDLQVNDILLVVQNNRSVPLANGDFVSVIAIGSSRSQANLNFLEVKVRSLASDDEHSVQVCLDLLYGSEANLTKDQQKHLMVDFSRRMKQDNISPNSDEYKEAMDTDPYLNCLRAKYGYAVTCHKSQGGEWDHVFLFLNNGMYGMPKPELFHWWYTAITRAKKELHLTRGWWIE